MSTRLIPVEEDRLRILERDAERYRWLKARPSTIHFDDDVAFVPRGALRTVYVSMIGNTELDIAIDASLKKARGQ